MQMAHILDPLAKMEKDKGGKKKIKEKAVSTKCSEIKLHMHGMKKLH